MESKGPHGSAGDFPGHCTVMISTKAMKTTIYIGILLALVFSLSNESASQPLVYGRVLKYNRSGPSFSYPGLEVAFVDAQRRRRYATITDLNGFYNFPSLPSCNYNYRMEIRGGGRILYSRVIMIPCQSTSIPPIVLP